MAVWTSLTSLLTSTIRYDELTQKILGPEGFWRNFDVVFKKISIFYDNSNCEMVLLEKIPKENKSGQRSGQRSGNNSNTSITLTPRDNFVSKKTQLADNFINQSLEFLNKLSSNIFMLKEATEKTAIDHLMGNVFCTGYQLKKFFLGKLDIDAIDSRSF